MIFFKKFLARKKDFNQVLAHEVQKALRVQEIEHLEAMNDMRLNHYKIQSDFEKDMRKESKRISTKLGKDYNEKLQMLKNKYDIRIDEYEQELKEMANNIKFAQDFWRDLYKEKDELFNIATVLQSKTTLIMMNEREEMQAQINKKADDLKDMNICMEKIENLSRRLDKRKTQEKGEKLMHILDNYESNKEIEENKDE